MHFGRRKSLESCLQTASLQMLTFLLICKHISMLEKMGLYLAIVLSSRWTTNSAPIGKTKLTKYLLSNSFYLKDRLLQRNPIIWLFIFYSCLSFAYQYKWLVYQGCNLGIQTISPQYPVDSNLELKLSFREGGGGDDKSSK